MKVALKIIGPDIYEAYAVLEFSRMSMGTYRGEISEVETQISKALDENVIIVSLPFEGWY